MAITPVHDQMDEAQTQQAIYDNAAAEAALAGEIQAAESQSKQLETADLNLSTRDAKAMGVAVDESGEVSEPKAQNSAEAKVGAGIIEKAAAEATGIGGVIEGASMIASTIGDKSYHAKGMGLDAQSFAKARTIDGAQGSNILHKVNCSGLFNNPKDTTTRVRGAVANSSSIQAFENCNKLKIGQHALAKSELGHGHAKKAENGMDAYNARQGGPAMGPSGNSTMPKLALNQRVPKGPTHVGNGEGDGTSGSATV